MLLADAAAGGVNLEALAPGAGMVLVAVILFVQKSAKPHVPVVLGLGGIALVVGSVTFFSSSAHSESGHADGVATEEEGFLLAAHSVCDALAASESDLTEANKIFSDRVHAPLHELAGATQEVDRAAAAELLEAKENVESELDKQTVRAAPLRAGLEDLAESSQAALAALDLEAEPCDA